MNLAMNTEDIKKRQNSLSPIFSNTFIKIIDDRFCELLFPDRNHQEIQYDLTHKTRGINGEKKAK
jgi:hypothetical protein